jgi:hypothetical protein
MINFNFCNDEELNLQNEDYCRLNMNYPIQSAFVDMYNNSLENSTEMKSKEKSNSISLDNEYKKNQVTYNQRKKMGKWTKEEDEILKELVLVYGGKCWKKVAEHIKGRTEIQCLHRWTKILQPGLVKGPWTIQEDRKLITWVKKFGPKKWSQCSEYIKGRSDKQCRERWFNCLNPKVKKGNWNAEEDYKIFFLYKKYGSKWAQIANFFEGRSENSVKNRFYSTLRRYVTEKKKSQGVKRNRKNCNEVQHLKETLSPNGIADIKPSSCSKEELLQYFEISFYEAKIKFVKEKKFTERDLKLFDSQIDKREYKNLDTNSNSVMRVLDSFENNNNEMNDDNINIIVKNSRNSPNMVYNDKRETKSQSSFSENNCLLNLNLNNLNFDLYSGFNNSQAESIKLNVSDSQLSREEAFNMYKNMDIYSLEKNISDICDENNFIFQEPEFVKYDNYIDNMMDGIFKNKNEDNMNMNIDNFSNFNHLEGDLNMNMNTGYEKICGSNESDGLFDSDFMQVSQHIHQSHINSDVSECHSNKLNDSIIKKNSGSFVNSTKDKSEKIEKNSEVLHSLFDQLNDLEKLIKSAKRELVRYEKSNGGK